MNDTTIYTTHPEVVSTATGDELVLLSFSTDTYYGLNAVGVRIWELLAQGGSVETICAVLLGEYDVAEDALRNDIRAIMQDLVSNSLVLPQES